MADELDLIAVGAGVGGLAAALAAHEHGLRVAVVERSEYVGGAAAYADGYVWVPTNHLQREAGIADSVEEGIRYVRAIGDESDLMEPSRTREWLEAGPGLVRWLESHGVRWLLQRTTPDYYFPEAAGSSAAGRCLIAEGFPAAALGEWRERLLINPSLLEGGVGRGMVPTGGAALVGALLRAVVEAHIPILTEHRVTALRTEGRAVTGVRCETRDGPVELKGSVILATSGYDWDQELVGRYSRLADGEWLSRSPSSITGDGLRLALSAGAGVLARPPETGAYSVAYRLPDDAPRVAAHDTGVRGLRQYAVPHCFIVDRSGRRFCDDSFHPAITRAVLRDRRADGSLEHSPFFLIWDKDHHQRYGLPPGGPGAPYPDGLVTSAPDLVELGERLGIDGVQLQLTAERFNEGARAGVDPDFGRGGRPTTRLHGDATHQPNPNLGPVGRPPVFGMRLYPAFVGIFPAGIRFGVRGRALADDGREIAGLYAIGSCASFTITNGNGYNSGFALGRAATYGRLAAYDIAERLRETSRAGA